MSFYKLSKKHESKIKLFKSKNEEMGLFSKIKKDVIKFTDKQATRKSSEVIIAIISNEVDPKDLTGSNH